MTLKTLGLALATTALVGTAGQAAEIAVIAGSAQDAFFNKIKRGVDGATLVVEANGGSVTYLTVPNYDNFGPDLVGLINTAISQGVDGIAIPIWVPDAQVPALQEAAAQGIEIMVHNSGDGSQGDVGGINFFGNNEYTAGLAGGTYLAEHGATQILCVIQVPGAVNLETRCDGVTEGAAPAGAEIIRLPLPASLDGNAAGTAEAIKAELLRNPEIDAVITLAAGVADAAAIAIAQAGMTETVQLGSFDMNQAGLERIAAGTQAMAIDQQPYLQSFLAVTMLAAKIDYALDLATDPVLTGPAIIDAGNVEATLAGVAAGVR